MPDELDVSSWLQEVALGAASAVQVGTIDGDSLVVAGRHGTYTAYQVQQPIARNERYNLYHCVLSTGRRGLLKIATDIKHNTVLDHEATILNRFNEEALRIDAGPTPDGVPFGYQNFVPQVEESFECANQNGRRINILTFTLFDGLSTGEDGSLATVEAEEPSETKRLMPLCYVWLRNHARLDPKSSAWLFGKGLKLLAKAHDMGIGIGDASASNILISPELHGVIFPDWTLARIYPDVRRPDDFPIAIAANEMSQLAHAVIKALGGSYSTGYLPDSDQLTDTSFRDFLWRLAKGRDVAPAFDEHAIFYEILGSMWPRVFHPYTEITSD